MKWGAILGLSEFNNNLVRMRRYEKVYSLFDIMQVYGTKFNSSFKFNIDNRKLLFDRSKDKKEIKIDLKDIEQGILTLNINGKDNSFKIDDQGQIFLVKKDDKNIDDPICVVTADDLKAGGWKSYESERE